MTTMDQRTDPHAVGRFDGEHEPSPPTDAEVGDTVAMLARGLRTYRERYEAMVRAQLEVWITEQARTYANAWVWGVRWAAAERIARETDALGRRPRARRSRSAPAEEAG